MLLKYLLETNYVPTYWTRNENVPVLKNAYTLTELAIITASLV